MSAPERTPTPEPAGAIDVRVSSTEEPAAMSCASAPADAGHVHSFADLAAALLREHGPLHDCFACASIRAELGLSPLVPLFARVARARPCRGHAFRSFVQAERAWRADAKRFGRWHVNGIRPDLSRGTEAQRSRDAAATGALLGVPVGLLRDAGGETSR